LDIVFASAIFFSPAREVVGETIQYDDSEQSASLGTVPSGYNYNGSGISGSKNALFAFMTGPVPIASSNTVTLDFTAAAGKNPAYVFGGIGGEGNAGRDLEGGLSASVVGNSVVFLRGTVTSNVYGGWGYSASQSLPVLVTGNKVTLGDSGDSSKVATAVDVYGGYADNTVGRAVADDNEVVVAAGSKVTGTVFDGAG
jgi:hypothetical protein